MDYKQQLLNEYPALKGVIEELFSLIPSDLQSLPLARDGAAQFLTKLPKLFKPEDVLDLDGVKGKNQRAWELVGYFYYNTGRFHEALAIFRELYSHMLRGQKLKNKRGHKGVPLVMLYECYKKLNYPVLAKRYLMLTLCEDSITSKGVIHAENSGVYFRLVWLQGLSHKELGRYAQEFYKLSKNFLVKVCILNGCCRKLIKIG